MQRHRPEGQRAVVVVDDGDLARPAGDQEVGGLVEQQPVGGVDGDQIRRLDVGGRRSWSKRSALPRALALPAATPPAI